VLLALTFALAFAAGSVPFGVLLARRRGVDIRTSGSGNIGATNVARVMGFRIGLIVLVLDALKGAVPVLLARRAGLDDWGMAAAALGAVLGHCFSPWLRFRGGKGVATALGVFLVLSPAAAAVAVAVFVGIGGVTRVPALGSLAGSVALSAMCVALESEVIAGLSLVVTTLIIVRHRQNLAELRKRRQTPSE
jgi:acyl phosphate:glycerol-3-phosphate acyltransferase